MTDANVKFKHGRKILPQKQQTLVQYRGRLANSLEKQASSVLNWDLYFTKIYEAKLSSVSHHLNTYFYFKIQ